MCKFNETHLLIESSLHHPLQTLPVAALLLVHKPLLYLTLSTEKRTKRLLLLLLEPLDYYKPLSVCASHCSPSQSQTTCEWEVSVLKPSHFLSKCCSSSREPTMLSYTLKLVRTTPYDFDIILCHSEAANHNFLKVSDLFNEERHFLDRKSG